MIHKELPKSFINESKILQLNGLNSWDSIIKLTDRDIYQLTIGTLGSIKNFMRLRCIGIFISKLDLSIGEAGLLIHTGISSINALASLTPQELVMRTGRLERMLGTKRNQVLDLKKASLWIKKAKQLKKS